MNDNALIAAVLREVADAIDAAYRHNARHDDDESRERFVQLICGNLQERALELDPPEKNEVPQ